MRPLEAVAYLHDRGAHFVLYHGKRAIWWRWQRRRPSLGLVLKHGREIGLIPYSVGASALDIDYGDIGELIEVKPPPGDRCVAARRPCVLPGRHTTR